MTLPLYWISIIGLAFLNAAVAMLGLKLGFGPLLSVILAGLATWVGVRMIRGRWA